MASTSRIVDVKDALLSILSNDAGLAGIQVTRGKPGDDIRDEAVWVGRAVGRHEPVTIRAGRQPRDETFTVDVVVSVLVGGGTIADAEDRAHVLMDEVEDAIAQDPSLGGVLVGGDWALPADLEESGSGYTDVGAICEIRLGVEVRARLT